MAPIHDAARRGDVDGIRKLLSNSTNPSDIIDTFDNEDGYTALHTAVLRGRSDIIRLLVNEFGADVNRPSYNTNYVYPIFSAISLSNSYQKLNNMKYDIVHALIVDGKADVLKRNSYGRTLLEESERQDCDKSIVELIRTHIKTAEATRKEDQENKRRLVEAAVAKRKLMTEEESADGGNKKTKTSDDNLEQNSLSDDLFDDDDDMNAKKPSAKEDEDNPFKNNEFDDDEDSDSSEEPEEDYDDFTPKLFLKYDNQEVIGAKRLIRLQYLIVRAQSVAFYQQQQQEQELKRQQKEQEQLEKERLEKERLEKEQLEKEQQQDNNDNSNINTITTPNNSSISTIYMSKTDRAVAAAEAVRDTARELTKQLKLWNPDQPAFAFFVPVAEVKAAREFLKTLHTYYQIVREKPMAGAVLAHGLLGVKDKGCLMNVRIKPISHGRKIAWSKRYYSTPLNRKRLLPLVKEATTLLKSMTIKNTICEIKFYTEQRKWYWPTVFYVGDSKKVNGGLFGIKFDCVHPLHLHDGD